MPVSQIICGDSLNVLPTLPRAKVIFADPPDNLGVKYDGYRDIIESYESWLTTMINVARFNCGIFWLSFNARYGPAVMSAVRRLEPRPADWPLFIWRFTFGQHRQSDCGNGYRPLLRIMQEKSQLYPDAIRVPSARQTKYGDKRADPRGRVPDDVWDFPRVCGTFKDRKKWHPCQHPKALIERIVKFSAVPGDLVIDMFAGSGNTLEVCKELGIDCIGIDISRQYCEKIAEETGAELIL